MIFQDSSLFQIHFFRLNLNSIHNIDPFSIICLFLSVHWDIVHKTLFVLFDHVFSIESLFFHSSIKCFPLKYTQNQS